MTIAYVEQFNALGQPVRLQIFRLLVRAGPRGLCVDDIRARVPMPGSTLSHHLDTLTRSRLLAAKRSGRFIYYAVDWNRTAQLLRFLTEDCCADLNGHLWSTRSAADGKNGISSLVRGGARRTQRRLRRR